LLKNQEGNNETVTIAQEKHELRLGFFFYILWKNWFYVYW